MHNATRLFRMFAELGEEKVRKTSDVVSIGKLVL